MRLTAAAIVAGLGFVSTGCGDEGRLAATASPIIGADARADLTHDAVVAVLGDGSLCSGAFVGRSKSGTMLVLTAAHCCSGAAPPRAIRTGSDYADPTGTFPVTSVTRHPCYNSLSNDYDLCVVEASDGGAFAAAPIPLAHEPDGLEPGSRVTLVGFGVTPAMTSVRRRAVGYVYETAPLDLGFDQAEGRGGVCFGDSGSPTLVDQKGVEVVAGVASFVTSTALCDIGGFSSRIATRAMRAEFLDRVLAGERSSLAALLVHRKGASGGQVRDTYLASDEPDRNFGASPVLHVGSSKEGGVRRALLRFDLTGLPAGAQVLSARMGLHVESKTGGGTLAVHRIAREWDEAHVTWASEGDRGFERGALASARTDTPLAEATSAVWFDLTDLAGQLQRGEAENLGLLVSEAEAEDTTLLSSEIARSSERPWMQLCYLPKAP